MNLIYHAARRKYREAIHHDGLVPRDPDILGQPIGVYCFEDARTCVQCHTRWYKRELFDLWGLDVLGLASVIDPYFDKTGGVIVLEPIIPARLGFVRELLPEWEEKELDSTWMVRDSLLVAEATLGRAA